MVSKRRMEARIEFLEHAHGGYTATQEQIQGMQMILTAEKFKSPRRIEESRDG